MAKPALERFLYIDQKLRSGVYPSTSELGQELGKSYKTIQRDIDFMRDRLSAPIDYDVSRKGWYYTERAYAFPFPKLTESDARTIQAAAAVLDGLGPLPGLEGFMQLARGLRAAAEEPSSAVSVGFGPQRIPAPRVLPMIQKAIERRETLRVRYRKRPQAVPEDRLMDPLHLRFQGGDWFLAARDHRSGQVRVFAVHRMMSAETTGNAFTPAPQFSSKTFFGDGIGIERGKKGHRVVLKLTGFAAQIAQETSFHPSEKRTLCKDGSVRLEMTVSGLTDVAMWAMARGPEVEVLEPKGLRQMVADELTRAATLYRRRSRGTRN
ncbi:MAG: WYL domain-containing protein [Nitrospirae bacterium]|nr:WYL domain-containing protein [Nitrospirota bacterium]